MVCNECLLGVCVCVEVYDQLKSHRDHGVCVMAHMCVNDGVHVYCGRWTGKKQVMSETGAGIKNLAY